MNIIYVDFPGLGFQGKNLCVMFVFSIVSFLFFSEYLFIVEIVQGYNLQLGGTGEVSSVNKWELHEAHGTSTQSGRLGNDTLPHFCMVDC
jgi:hypothetical protein